MRKILIIIGIVLSLLSSLEAKKYALIVGMPSGFKGPVAEGIKIDTNNIKELLKKYDFKITKLSDPTTKQFRKVMKSFKKLKKEDTFIFYYSGHGAQTKDRNGDEKDGKDEAIVLNPPHSLIIDDEMYSLLSKIKANKYVFFDSCHSGTAFKFQDDDTQYQSKSLGFIDTEDNSQFNSFAEKKVKNTLVFMGAAADGTSAIGTSQGGYFTNALIDGLKRKKADLNKNGKITFDELLKFTRNQIKNSIHNKKRVYKPQLSNSNYNKSIDVLSVLRGSVKPQNVQSSSQINIATSNQINTTNENTIILPIESNLEKKLDKLRIVKKAESIDINYKKTYFEGDNLTFSIDAYGQNGYLYIIYSDLQKHTLLYPNSHSPKDRINSGILNFPNDISSKLKFTVKKPHGRAVVFAIMSPVPLNLYRKKGSAIFDIFDRDSSKVKYLLRELLNVDTSLDKLLIGKAVFTVSEGI